MTDNQEQESRPAQRAHHDAADRQVFSPVETIALIVSLLWMVGAGVYFVAFRQPSDAAETGLYTLQIAMMVMAVVVPVALVWVAAMAARSARVMRDESRRLRAAIDAIRHAYVTQSQRGGAATESNIARKLDEIASAQRKTETALLTISSIREHSVVRAEAPVPPARSVDEGQAPLPLGPSDADTPEPLAREDFIRAMNFPETAEDQEGFAALRKALRDRQSALLIQASQDILTLLSQDGIYMDDLRVDAASAETWRRFAAGDRGPEVASLGGIRDRSCLALAAGRMKQDPIFRDVAHHFLRRFDKMFIEFEKSASDAEIQGLSETRTARAFMLLGRVAAIFD
ncbi:hypothetical protein DL237_07295 [Pseudooceanicola sediminis]|uniref:Uncharacterized protein n=1 Tax=Pseudooceanicola sediminis TaxID=2211117 RepID=A0A399J4X1_9RHOB|nr:hypothetical protein [Pseudooceanicola sediminis]RII39439.1 hypothetical protein DL237_07295 [Pseudooceanicola sediminis]|tara:strand:- start:23508 stop:24536 length:1029 start_codon:yes stop_codon:yes gene_type:complete